jgi:hypothetical protein
MKDARVLPFLLLFEVQDRCTIKLMAMSQLVRGYFVFCGMVSNDLR